MLTRLFKFAISFVLLFSFFSINIKGTSIFNHLSKLTSPFQEKINKTVVENVAITLKKGSDWGKRLFDNADPKIIQDRVIKTQSSTKKDMSQHYTEDILPQDKKHLSDIINKE